MTTASQLDRLFPAKTFNDSPVKDILISKERAIYVVARTDRNMKEFYNTFYDLFVTYLNKLPTNNVKTFVSEVYNKNMIYIGTSASGNKNEVVFSRLLLSPDGTKVTGIVLDSVVLDIDLKTGETPNIDDCIYATYFGLIRAAILTNRQDIVKNKDLHKLICTYIFLIMLRALGSKVIYTDKQKVLVQVACIYAFYRHYLDYNHARAISTIKSDYSEIVNKDMMKEFVPLLDNISKYKTLKDLPKIFVDLKVYFDNPSNILMELLKLLQSVGFYSLLGPLDQTIAMICLAKYPTNLYPKTANVTNKIHDAVEDIIIEYIKKLKYEPTMLLEK